MRKFATIKGNYLEEETDDLTHAELHVEMGLLITAQSNSAGIFQMNLQEMSSTLKMEEDDLLQALNGLEEKGRVILGKKSWVFVIKRWEMETPQCENNWKGVLNVIDMVPTEMRQYFTEVYGDDPKCPNWTPHNTGSEQGPNRVSTGSELLEQEQEQEQEQESDTESEQDIEPETERDIYEPPLSDDLGSSSADLLVPNEEGESEFARSQRELAISLTALDAKYDLEYGKEVMGNA